MEKGERRVQNAYYVLLLIPIIMMVIKSTDYLVLYRVSKK